MWDVIKQIVSPAVVTVVVTALIAMAQSIRKDKLKNRHIDHRDAETKLDAFQAAAETHILEYDVPMRERVMQLETLLNQTRVANGQEAVPFAPLPKAMPLFPKSKT